MLQHDRSGNRQGNQRSAGGAVFHMARAMLSWQHVPLPKTHAGLIAAFAQCSLRQARKRFGAEVADQSEPLLERSDDPKRLEDLGEALLDSADGEVWLRGLTPWPVSRNADSANPLDRNVPTRTRGVDKRSASTGSADQ